MINSRIFHRTDRSVQPGDEKKTPPNLNARRCIAQPRMHTRTPGNTPGLGLQGHAGRRIKPARRLGSAVRSYAFPSPRLSGALSEKYRSTLGHFDPDLVIIFCDHFNILNFDGSQGVEPPDQGENCIERTIAVMFRGPRDLSSVRADVPSVLPGDDTAAVRV